MAKGSNGQAAWAKQQLEERRYYIDPSEPNKVYSLSEVDGGVREDWGVIVGAIPVIAAGIVYLPAVLAASDVVTVGVPTYGIATGTVVAGRTVGFFAGLFGPKTTKLYRSVSEAELQSIQSLGRFSEGPNSLSAKWFATTFDDAIKHSNDLPGNTRIVEVTVPKSSLSNAEFRSNLDLKGPAYAYDIDFLNSTFITVKVVK